MMKPAIVAIAYNRPDSLKRLLGSIARASYSSDDISLIISIDRCRDEAMHSKVLEVANDLEWKHGTKQIVDHEANLGLKAHVLECSAYAKEYGSVIVLEDDLFVSEDYYKFACAALEYCKDTQNSDIGSKLAGVSLYDHRLNVHVREPFEAINDGFDNWYFQFASSWGQAYTKSQWEQFEKWLSSKNDPNRDIAAVKGVPANVVNWGDKSWLRIYIMYMIETDKYFLYPRAGFSTNFSEEGTHKMGQSSELQIPMKYKSAAIDEDGFRFSSLEESLCVYDAYFENVSLQFTDILKEYTGGESAVIDLYGGKPEAEFKDKGYLLSSKAYPYRVVKAFKRTMRPHEANIIEDIGGNDFYLYDLKEFADMPQTYILSKLLYNYRAFKAAYGVKIILARLSGKK